MIVPQFAMLKLRSLVSPSGHSVFKIVVCFICEDEGINGAKGRCDGVSLIKVVG